MKTPEQGESWGILGGTFDPIHNGHLCLASEILKIKKLDGILFVPSFSHPFKKNQTHTSYEDRLTLVKIAVSANNAFCVSTIEKDQSLSGYTLDTIRAIKKYYNSVQFYFLIGADNIAQIPLWRNAKEIVNEIQIIAGKRPPIDMHTIENDFSSSIEYIESSEIEVSSTEIKNLLMQKEFEKLKNVLNPDVLKYIIERNLYQS